MSEIKEKLLKIESMKRELQNEEDLLKKIKETEYNNQIIDVTPDKMLQEQSDVFMTSANKKKLHAFVRNFHWLKLDLIYEKTNTYCLQVKLDKNFCFEDLMSEIELFLPSLVYVPNILERPFPVGGLHVKVLDPFMGDEGSISIIKPDHTSEIWVTRQYDGIFTIIEKFESFKKAFYFCYEKFSF